MRSVASGNFRLKGSALLERSREKGRAQNAHQAHLKSEVSWPTVLKYLDQSDKIRLIDTESLYGIIVDGLGFSRNELRELSFLDVFDMIAYDEENGRGSE